MLFLSGYTAKRLLGIKYPIPASAFLANMNFILKYSNEFKQYLSEGIWVLLVLILYYFYKEKGLTSVENGGRIYDFYLGRQSRLLFIGGVLLYEFAGGLIKKGQARVRKQHPDGNRRGRELCGVLYLLAAGHCPQRQYAELLGKRASFPLFPVSIEDLQMAVAMVYEIFSLPSGSQNLYGSAGACRLSAGHILGTET